MKLLRKLPLSFAFASAAVLAILVGACGDDSPTSPSSTAPFSKTDLRVGTGTEAVNGKVLTVNYTGWLYDETKADHKGLLFDTSLGRSTYSFTLGAGEVIAGWDQGMVGAKVGGLRQLVLPPSLAYGSKRTSSIPPNATLLFEVELLDVQ